MKNTHKIILLVGSIFAILAFNGPRDNPTVPHIVYTVNNVKKFLEIGDADQQLAVNPSGTGFIWSDPGGLSANSVDSTHVVNGGLSLDDLASGGASDGAALEYDAVNGWQPSTAALLTGIGASGRMAYYTGAQTMGNVASMRYDESGNDKHLQVRGSNGQSRIGGSSTAGELYLESVLSSSQESFQAGSINIRRSLGSFSTPTNLTNDSIKFGGIYLWPYINGAYRLNGALFFQGDGTTSGNNYSTKMLVQTSSGSAASTTRMEVGSDGQVTYNTYTSSSAFPGTTSHFVTMNSSGEFLTKGAAAMMSELIAGNISLESNKITDLANGTVSSDAINKEQLDSVGSIVSNYHSLDFQAIANGDTLILTKEETLVLMDGSAADIDAYIDGSAVGSGAKIFIKFGNTSTDVTLNRDATNDPGNFIAESSLSTASTLNLAGDGMTTLLKYGSTWYQLH